MRMGGDKMEKSIINIKAKDKINNIPTIIYGIEKTSAKGIVIISHGFGEHAARYEEFAMFLTKANYICVSFEQRGHGNLFEDSAKKRKEKQGIIPNYQTFLDDIDMVVTEMKLRFPRIPLVLFGHSMGGNIALNYLLKHNQNDFSCAILESPWLGLYKEVNPVVVYIAKLFSSVSTKMAIINKLSLDEVTGDKEKAKEIETDPLYHNRISFRMFSGIKDGCDTALNNASRLSIPIYLAAAKN